MRAANTTKALDRTEPASRTAPHARWNWSHVAIGLSFANLAFIPRWTQMLDYSGKGSYLMKLPPAPAEYCAAIASVFLLGAMFFLITHVVEGIQPGRFFRIARCCWLLLLFKPAFAFLPLVYRLVSPVLGQRAPLLLLGFVVSALAFALWPERLYPWGMRLLLILSPFVVVTTARASWDAIRYDPTPFLDKPGAPPLASEPSAHPRVVWLVFDEMDQRLTFENRSPGLQLPELDRFRAASVCATRAYPPASSTLSSLPSLILGKRVTAKRAVSPSGLLLSDDDVSPPAGWAGQPNVFSRARALGANTALGGWYHPYCRVLGADLTNCYWFEAEEWVNVTGRTFAQGLLNQTAMTVYLPYAESLVMSERVRRRSELMSWSRALVKDKSLGLIFLHLSSPHVPFVYNRLGRQFVTQNPEGYGFNPQHYADGLALADRSLGRLREAMQEAHVWESTTVLISSDHWYRNSQALDGKIDHRVPFLVKLAGQTSAVSYGAPFNTAMTQGLVLAILKREVVSPGDVLAWLDLHHNEMPLDPLR